MGRATIATALLLALISTLAANGQASGFVSVSFAIDGKPARCNPFGVELRFDGKTFKPSHIGQKFEVPALFQKPSSHWRDDQSVDVSLTCNEKVFVFSKVHPGFLGVSDWELGIARPPYSIENFRRTRQLEQGAWLSYLHFQGEPGVLMFVSQPDLPAEYAEALRKEQPNASGERARDIAYAMAVFGVDYRTNRDSLLLMLSNCLSKPKDSTPEDQCDDVLLDFVTNLYWRGDDSMLVFLLRMADTRRDVIGEIGTFYADLLERRGATALELIGTLSAGKQQLICRLAYEDDLRSDPPKRESVIAFLTQTGSDTAARCAAALDGSQ